MRLSSAFLLFLPSVFAVTDIEVTRREDIHLPSIQGASSCFEGPVNPSLCLAKFIRKSCPDTQKGRNYVDLSCLRTNIMNMCQKQYDSQTGDYDGCVKRFHLASLVVTRDQCSDDADGFSCFLHEAYVLCDGKFGCVSDSLKKICPDGCISWQKTIYLMGKLKDCDGNLDCIDRDVKEGCGRDLDCAVSVISWFCGVVHVINKESTLCFLKTYDQITTNQQNVPRDARSVLAFENGTTHESIIKPISEMNSYNLSLSDSSNGNDTYLCKFNKSDSSNGNDTYLCKFNKSDSSNGNDTYLCKFNKSDSSNGNDTYLCKFNKSDSSNRKLINRNISTNGTPASGTTSIFKSSCWTQTNVIAVTIPSIISTLVSLAVLGYHFFERYMAAKNDHKWMVFGISAKGNDWEWIIMIRNCFGIYGTLIGGSGSLDFFLNKNIAVLNFAQMYVSMTLTSLIDICWNAWKLRLEAFQRFQFVVDLIQLLSAVSGANLSSPISCSVAFLAFIIKEDRNLATQAAVAAGYLVAAVAVPQPPPGSRRWWHFWKCCRNDINDNPNDIEMLGNADGISSVQPGQEQIHQGTSSSANPRKEEAARESGQKQSSEVDVGSK